jgi:hypothetical protein
MRRIKGHCEWVIEKDELLWSQNLIPTKKKTPIFKIDMVSIWPTLQGQSIIRVQGEGLMLERPFPEGAVWIYREVER